MRYRDLIGLSAGLVIAIIFGINFLSPTFAERFGIPPFYWLLLSFFGWLLLAPILYAVLTPLNNLWRQWRKEHGRDIEEEERYETEDGMIRLTPNDPASRVVESPLTEKGLFLRVSPKDKGND
jgi:hypothetical protein